MVVVQGDGGAPGAQAECPIIVEWLKLDALVARAANGKIALIRTEDIDRDTVCDNYELLVPLVKELGGLNASQVLLDVQV